MRSESTERMLDRARTADDTRERLPEIWSPTIPITLPLITAGVKGLTSTVAGLVGTTFVVGATTTPSETGSGRIANAKANL